MKLFENEGALFRGIDRAWPKEVWTLDGWKPYKGDVPKDIDWGNYVDEAQAQRLMDADKARKSQNAPKQAAE